jgi:glycosyltransferase involved in cell wall biosynthesis
MRALYISYDGLLDQIGTSQILPYLHSISTHVDALHILSFEKKQRFDDGGEELLSELLKKGIAWHPVIFSSKFGSFGKLYDLMKMYLFSFQLTQKYKIQLVHSRGHVAAQIGIFLKTCFGIKLIFDCRGLWVDERVNKGGWDLSRWLDRQQYQIFKSIEKAIISRADKIIVLTEAVVDEIVRIGQRGAEDIVIIPCCADFQHFTMHGEARKQEFRESLELQKETLVIGYLGSIGPMYKFESYARLVLMASLQHPNICGLVVTRNIGEASSVLNTLVKKADRNIFKIVSAEREAVPNFINAFDIMVNFLTVSYARIATSPTRNAESFACGVPVICNQGIGDVDLHTRLLDSGYIVPNFFETDFQEAINNFESIQQKCGQELRDKSKKLFDLEIAEARYKNVYFDLLC